MKASKEDIAEFLSALPWKQDANGYAIIKRSHVVVFLETGKVVNTDEIVHHKNENKSDDRPENLEVMLRSDHQRTHAIGQHARGIKRTYESGYLEALSNRMKGNRFASRPCPPERAVQQSEKMKQVWQERREGKRPWPKSLETRSLLQ